MNWDQLDWTALDRLRDLFLRGTPTLGPYWQSVSDLANYDFTYGERIGWKWDAVLQGLDPGEWRSSTGAIVDWGCGSGVAGRRIVDWLGGDAVAGLHLIDHSALAVQYAAAAATTRWPGLRVQTGPVPPDKPISLLVISHVLNELDGAGRGELRRMIGQAETVLWVEPGTHSASRDLGAIRDELLGRFDIVAPCPHRELCGVIRPGNEGHWCHFFARPPGGIFAESSWVRFAQRAGIDLRSLPYCYLVLTRRPREQPQKDGNDRQEIRILGLPRKYKGFAKVFGCQISGVGDLVLQKRDARDLFKRLDELSGRSLLARVEGDRLKEVFLEAPSESQTEM
ncbi:MAG: hypothetical protein EXS36_15765 [Pedosphaera sp.]|nr:hypothetical protein [Pedosphaera sp.]